MKQFFLFAVALGAILWPSAAFALPSGWTETRVTGGLNQPTSMAFTPDGRLFVTEQGGKVRVIQRGKLLSQAFATMRTTANGERGLLGIAIDPQFSRNGYVYMYYTVSGATTYNKVSRVTADPANPNVALSGSLKTIVNLDKLSSATNHNGGAIHFGLDGKLYIAVGENANRDYAQVLTNRHGKMLRINKDGSIPTDNPFYTKTTGANRMIWAFGLRNPYTFAIDPIDGRMNINDVGQSSREEINRGKAGANYGWPECEGKCTASQLSPVAGVAFVDPLYSYGRSVGGAITGGAFYRAQLFGSTYRGDYFFSDYTSTFIKRLTPDGRVLNWHTSAKSPLDIDIGNNGKLYYLSIYNGAVYRISP